MPHSILTTITVIWSTPEENPGSTEPHDSENIEAADDNNNYDYIPKDSNMNLAKPADSSMDWSTHSAIGITFPYDDLRNVVTVGISNAMRQSDDGSIRSAALTVNYDSRLTGQFCFACLQYIPEIPGTFN